MLLFLSFFLFFFLFLLCQNELIKNIKSSVWHDLWINYIFSFRAQPFESRSAHKVKITELKIVLAGNTNNTSIIQIFHCSSTSEIFCSPCFQFDRDIYLIFLLHLPGFDIITVTDSVNHYINCNGKKFPTKLMWMIFFFLLQKKFCWTLFDWGNFCPHSGCLRTKWQIHRAEPQLTQPDPSPQIFCS